MGNILKFPEQETAYKRDGDHRWSWLPVETREKLSRVLDTLDRISEFKIQKLKLEYQIFTLFVKYRDLVLQFSNDPSFRKEISKIIEKKLAFQLQRKKEMLDWDRRESIMFEEEENLLKKVL